MHADGWQPCRGELQEASGLHALHIIGRSKGQKLTVDRDFVVERQHIKGQVYIQIQPEMCFSQPNGEMCLNMVSWAKEAVKGSEGDCLELYCGSGNFTIPLAQHFGQVVATEVCTRFELICLRHAFGSCCVRKAGCHHGQCCWVSCARWFLLP